MDRSKSFKRLSPGNKTKFSCEHSNYILEKYSKELQDIFNYYCSFGDSLNSNTLKSSTFTKLYREAGVVKLNDSKNEFGIKINDFDSILFKIVNNSEKTSNFNSSINDISVSNSGKRQTITNSNVKIDFNSFINSIEILANILFTKNNNIVESIDLLVMNYIFTLNKIVNNKKNCVDYSFLYEKEKNQDLVK